MRINPIKLRADVVTGIVVVLLLVSVPLLAQTNPAPQLLPYSQDFGAVAFSVLPNGFAGWNGVSGATALSQSAAEASIPTGDASVKTATVVQSTGGLYGYVSNGNGKVYVQGSNNATNGVNQLALAIVTKGKTSLKINYKITMLFPSSRTIGVVLQFRTGSGGAWESLPNCVYEYNSSARVAGQEDSFVDIPLPARAEDKDTVQFRWAVWHGIETGTVSGIGIDDISIYAGIGTMPPAPPILALPADASSNQPLSLSLAWNASSSATNYRLQVSSNPEFNPTFLDSSSIAGLSVQVSGLSNNMVYYWRVSASNASGTSVFSPPRTFSTVWTLLPSIPVLQTPSNGDTVSPTNLFCQWNASSGALTYRCQVSSDSLFANIVFDDSLVAAPSVQIQGMKPEAHFWWRVNARNNTGTTSFSAAWSFTTASVYHVPQESIFPGQSGSALLASLATQYTATTVLSYDAAREKIYGEIDKVGDTLKCVYSGFACYMTPGVPALTAAANGGINAEHTFPQSVGAGSGNASSDMNHIYGAKSNVNSARGNLPFAELADSAVLSWYRLGTSLSTMPSGNTGEYSKLGISSFEPRNAHKGHVARAIFYFYTIYKSQSSASFFDGMKETLLKWHSLYPVDSTEYARTVKIAAYQSGKVNPFIVDTTLVRRAYVASTGVSRMDGSIPQTCSLEQNYPNPYNPSTTIRYQIPRETFVTLKIYDLLGREVATMVNEKKEAGSYAVSWNAGQSSTGIYFYSLQAGEYRDTKRMILIK